MNYSVNFSTSTSANSTTQLFGVLYYLEVCVYIINVLFGLPTHAYIIWLIVMKTRSGIASELFNLNFSVCEIGICVDSVIVILSCWFKGFLNILDKFLVGLCTTGRPLFESLICVERYLAVVHPVIFLKYKPLRYRLICSSVVWMYVLGICCICMYILYLGNSRTFAWLMSMQHILFLSVQLFCLVSVLRALKQSGPGDRRIEEENHMKRRAFHLILITTVSMFIQYLPFAIAEVFIILTENNIPIAWFTGWACFVLAGFVQPFLYLHHTGKLSCLCSSYQICNNLIF